MPTGLGDEQLWISPTNDGTGTSSARNDLSVSTKSNAYGVVPSVVSDTDNGGSYAFDFDGTADNLSWSYNPSVQSNGIATWTAWFKISSSQGGHVLAGNLSTHKNGGGLEVKSDGSLRLVLGKGASGNYSVYLTTATGLAPNDQWNHVAGVFDGTDAKIYVNGTLASTASINGLQSPWQRLFRMGAYGSGASNDNYGSTNISYSGLLDDCRAYDRALSTAEITRLASSRGIEGPPPVGLGDEKLWLSPTNNNTGTSTAFDDQSGNGNNGTASGTLVVADTDGGTYAFDFDGTNDDISTPFADTSTTSTGVFSMACWVKYDSVAATGGLMSGDMRTGRTGLSMYFDVYDSSRGHSGLLNPAVGGQYSGRVFAGDRDTINTGQWYHVAYTGDGSTARIYVDGVEENSATQTLTTSGAWSYPLRIGSYIDNGTVEGYLNGRMDDARVYTRTLTPAEITHLASSRGVEGPPPAGLGDEQLWWCPTHTGDLLLDSSSEGHSVINQGTAPTLVADTDEGGQYAGQFTTSGCLRIEDAFEFMTTGDCSVSGWIKGATAARVTICGQQAGGAASTKSGVAFDQVNSETRAKFFDGINNDPVLSAGNTPPNNTWYHATVTKEGSTCKIFVDGVLFNTGTKLGTPSNPDYKDVLIGGGWDVANPFYASTGYMDDIRFYDRAITQAEITHLAEARGIEGPPPVGLGGEQLWLCPSLNDSADDISGNGNNGTYQGGMGTVADTSEGGSYAYYFDGVDDEIDLASLNNWNDGTEYSFSMWSLADATPSRWYPYRATGSGSNREYYSNYGDTTYIHRASNGAGSTGNQPSAQLMGTWIHSAVTYDGTTMRLFLDGVEIDSYTVSPLSAATSLRIGNNTTTTAKMDDIRSYNRVLAQSEITHLATSRGIEGSPSGPPSSVFYNPFKLQKFQNTTFNNGAIG